MTKISKENFVKKNLDSNPKKFIKDIESNKNAEEFIKILEELNLLTAMKNNSVIFKLNKTPLVKIGGGYINLETYLNKMIKKTNQSNESSNLLAEKLIFLLNKSQLFFKNDKKQSFVTASVKSMKFID